MKNKTLISIQITIWSCIIIFLVSIFVFAVYRDFGGESINTFSGDSSVEYTAKIDNINNIKVDLVSEEVEVYLRDIEDIEIIQSASYTLKEEDQLRINTVGKSIDIDKRYSNHIFNFWDNINRREIITIYIPEDYKGEFQIKTVSGTIRLQDLILENLKCNATSGDIEIENLEIQEDLEIDTVSGDITLEQIKANAIDTHTTSGSISMDNVITNKTENKTTSGDIEFKGKCDTFRNSATSGRIEVKLEDMFKEFNASSVSGDIRIEIPENNGFKLKYHTTSGDLRTDFDLDDDVYKDGSAQMVVKTTSGNLTIEN